MGAAGSVVQARELNAATAADPLAAADDDPLAAARAEIARLRRTLRDQLGAFAEDPKYAVPVREQRAAGGGGAAVEWLSARAFLPAGRQHPPTLFGRPGDDPELAPRDVVQSAHLGNCYLIAALSVLAERPALVRALFPDAGDGVLRAAGTGVGADAATSPRVAVRLHHQNQWRTVYVDGRFAAAPVREDEEAAVEDDDGGDGGGGGGGGDKQEEEGSDAKEEETGDGRRRLYYGKSARPGVFWVSYLEKAYAKIYGSYAALSGGDISEALGDLTGRPVLSIRVDHEPKGLWQTLVAHHAAGQLMACGWCGSDEDAAAYSASRDALVIPQHAYAILSMKTLKGTGRGGGQQCWVHLRNPWGNSASGARRPLPAVPAAVRKQLDILAEASSATAAGGSGRDSGDDAGTFWLSWSDFSRALNCVYVCLLNVGAIVPMPDLSSASSVQDTREEIWGQWTGATCGGCSTFATWRQNPKYALRVAVPGTVTLTLVQDDMRLARRHEEAALETVASAADPSAGAELAFTPLSYHQVGLEVVTIGEGGGVTDGGGEQNKTALQKKKTKKSGGHDDGGSGGGTGPFYPHHLVSGSYQVVAKSAFWNKRNVTLQFQVTPEVAAADRPMLLIPSTYFPREAGRFLLSVRFLPDDPKKASVMASSASPSPCTLTPLPRPMLGGGAGATGGAGGAGGAGGGASFRYLSRVSGEWSKARRTAGGRASGNNTQFHTNLQWQLQIGDGVFSKDEGADSGGGGGGGESKGGGGRKAGEAVVRVVLLLRNDLLGGKGAGAERTPLPKSRRPGMGLCVFRGLPCVRSAAHTSEIEKPDQMGKTIFSNALEVAQSLVVRKADLPLLIVPAAHKAGDQAKFTVEAIADAPVALVAAPAKRPAGFVSRRQRWEQEQEGGENDFGFGGVGRQIGGGGGGSGGLHHPGAHGAGTNQKKKKKKRKKTHPHKPAGASLAAARTGMGNIGDMYAIL